ncbi:MAG: hypothetical protein ABIR15_12960 [Chitinophagaceae bacterium]
MKKQTALFCYLLLFLCLLQFISCIKPPSNFNPADGNNVYTGCRIKQTVSLFTSADGSLATRKFTYNSKGDPVTVISDRTSTGSANLEFKYDSKGRLVEYNAGYPNGSYDFKHRYGYSQNRITTDTTTGGFNPFGFPITTIITWITYDNLNRIVKDSSVVQNSSFSYVTEYSYDVEGNKVIKGVVYDDKLNAHRTNKVWMFIDRDYSVNNPAGANAYNSVGLPLYYPANAAALLHLGYFYYGEGPVIITYDCK